jgi:predicted acylesterase/phospholipase RssA
MTRRSLMLAGGGLKIAYQAGVLQVWLDEAAIEFDHADAVSAAAFNLAMWCNGMSGRRIADNWRGFRPLRGISVSPGVVVAPFAESYLTYGRFRRNVLPKWGLDWDVIRATDRRASFNVFNFTKQQLEAIEPARMNEDLLVAAGSLPMWFPPITVGGQLYVDAVHATASNLNYALDQGADELWIIWTTSTTGEWRRGFVREYFAIFEEATNSRLRAGLAEIEHNNACHARGAPSRYGRHITVRMLKAEVPLAYLLNFSHRRFAAAVEMGVRDARAWCERDGHLIPAG